MAEEEKHIGHLADNFKYAEKITQAQTEEKISFFVLIITIYSLITTFREKNFYCSKNFSANFNKYDDKELLHNDQSYNG